MYQIHIDMLLENEEKHYILKAMNAEQLTIVVNNSYIYAECFDNTQIKKIYIEKVEE